MPISDTTEIPILGSQAAPVEVPTGPGASVALSVHGYRAVDLWCYVSALGSLTSLDVGFEFSAKHAPSADDWAPVQSQHISAGLAELSDYTARKALAAPALVLVSMEVRGLWMRPAFGVVGDAAGSLFYATALRRA